MDQHYHPVDTSILVTLAEKVLSDSTDELIYISNKKIADLHSRSHRSLSKMTIPKLLAKFSESKPTENFPDPLEYTIIFRLNKDLLVHLEHTGYKGLDIDSARVANVQSLAPRKEISYNGLFKEEPSDPNIFIKACNEVGYKNVFSLGGEKEELDSFLGAESPQIRMGISHSERSLMLSPAFRSIHIKPSKSPEFRLFKHNRTSLGKINLVSTHRSISKDNGSSSASSLLIGERKVNFSRDLSRPEVVGPSKFKVIVSPKEGTPIRPKDSLILTSKPSTFSKTLKPSFSRKTTFSSRKQSKVDLFPNFLNELPPQSPEPPEMSTHSNSSHRSDTSIFRLLCKKGTRRRREVCILPGQKLLIE